MSEEGSARPTVGGQAVLEGVMMRGPASWSLACRKPDQTIAVERHDLPGLPRRHGWLKWPLLRGCVVLGESLVIGMKALRISANHAMALEDDVSDRQVGATFASALVFFSLIFIALPFVAVRLLEHLLGTAFDNSPILFSVVEGTMRLVMFVGYLLFLSRFEDVARVFEYHGAEHKTIYAYENGDALVPEEIDSKYPTLHVRCGTNFLFIVLFLTILVHFAVDVVVPASFIPRALLRIAAIPALAALSYEVIKLASRNERSLLFRMSMLPGLALQRITTKPPTLAQIEVAIAAVRVVAADIESHHLSHVEPPV